MIRKLRPVHLAARQAVGAAAAAGAPARAGRARVQSTLRPLTTHSPKSGQASYWLAGSLVSAAVAALALKPELNLFRQSCLGPVPIWPGGARAGAPSQPGTNRLMLDLKRV